ncbi:MAG: hypothetical protein KDD63_17000 [Bacteroidetes bacterium]|nr:hypothetical protein [Bacteroidota bacterium]MCB0853928.1 hypothetical protein [Bacteroidota bacterium]
MSSQQYIVSVFANDGQRSLGIEAEFNELANYMGDWNQDDPYMCFHPLPVIISENLKTKLDLFSSQISIFHFSGHANKKRIDLQTLNAPVGSHFTKQQLAVYLSPEYCPNLKVVFLNACNTKELADELIAKGVPIVIGTNSLVSDTTAQKVSLEFFRCLKNGKVKPLSEILRNFGKSLKSLAKSTPNSQGGIFFLEEEEEADSEWFISYGGMTDSGAAFSDVVKKALTWIPYPIQVQTPEATTNLPVDQTQVIKENLKLFDFTDQRNPINLELYDHKIGVFHLHGEPDRGLSWISKDFQGQYFERKPDLLSIELQMDHLDDEIIEEVPVGIEKLIEDIWRKVVETFGEAGVSDQNGARIEQLSDILFRQIQLPDNRDIVVKITDPGIFGMYLLQTISPSLADYFIQPFKEIIARKIRAIQPVFRQKSLKNILILLVTETQVDQNVLPNLFGNPVIQVLPPIKNTIASDDLKTWKENVEAMNHPVMQPILAQWDQIPTTARPMYILERVCELLGYQLAYVGGSRKEYRIQKINI